MKRRNFMKAAGLLALTPAVTSLAATQESHTAEKQIYEYRIYSLTGNNTEVLDEYLGNCMIPAYNRMNIFAGAFKNYKQEDDQIRSILLIYPNITAYHKAKTSLWNDFVFRKAAQAYFDATAVKPAFTKIDTYLAEAFDSVPQLRRPLSKRTMFEMRVYQSPNEEANKRKIKMFNEGEIALFDKTGVNSVCYGDILAGPGMAALLYLTWSENDDLRNAAWKAFSSHPDWKAMAADKQYANSATNNKSTLLLPMDYSQL